MPSGTYPTADGWLFVGALTQAIYPFPKFSLPVQGAPRRSLGATGRIVANEIVHPLPARSIGELTRPSSVPTGASIRACSGS